MIIQPPRQIRAAANHRLFFAILVFLLLPTESLWADLSVAYSGSSDQAVIVSFFDRQTVGSSLVGTLQIQNISGTWVYIEQDLTSSPNPVAMPYTIYLLGPDAIKTFPNFTFPQGSYVKLVVTTPVGLDFTQASEKRTALQGALAVDLLTRGLLTFSLPPDAFDQPPVGQVVEPLLDNLIATVSPIGELAVAIQDRSATEVSSALLDIAADSTHVVNALTPLVQRYATADQVASSLGFFAELINLPEKAALVTDLTAMTFQAPPVTWSRMDVLSRTQVPSIASVSPTVLMTMPVPQTQALTVHGSGFTSASSLVFTIGTATYPSRPERLQFIDANTLQYNIAVGSAVGTWSVRLADGTGSATFQVQAAPSGLYTITPLSGPHGSITPSAALTRAGGESQTFVATPQDSTFTVDTWYLDGVAVPATGNRFTLADIQAPHTVYVTFRLATVAGQTGSLTVSLQPAGAVTAGAQWQVDGGSYRNNNDIVTGLTPGAHPVSFKPVAGYTAPTNQSVTIVSNQTASATGSYASIAPTTYLLMLNQGGSMGSISPSPVGTWNGSAYAYSSGSVVQLTASANPGYHFVSWSGDVSGSGNPVTVTMNGNKSVTASFASGDPNLGTISVTLQPAAAVTAGAQWKFNSSGWTNSGASFNTPLLGANQNYLQFKDVAGWVTPRPFFVTVGGGQTTNVTVTYQQDMTPGLLTVALSPPDAVAAGAKWHVNGGAYGNGASVPLTPGSYPVTFDSVSGWTAPSSQTVTMQPAQTVNLSCNYTPPAGQPVIGSVSPPIGPMTGGTAMTINGVNFTAPATVIIGGQSAANVSVSSSTQVICLTPASTNFGSAKVVVQTSAGSATNANGFAYGVARGSKLDLLSAFGGSCFGVNVKDTHAYAGEGRNLLVLDVSSPASPSKVGQIVLPGPVMKIGFLGNYAYVAAMEGGLQVVDISSPSTPVVRGFFATSTNINRATGITIFGGRAYVTDENVDAGLEIFDLGNPTTPVLLSSTPLGGSAHDVVVKASAGGTFAYVTTGSSLQIVDVSQPATPVLRGATGIGSSTYSIALSGNYVFGADAGSLGALHMVDVSNPDSPADLNPSAGGYSQGWYHAVTAQNNYLYAESVFQGIGLLVFNISGTNLVKIAQLPNLHLDAASSTYYDKMIASGNQVFVASGDAGLQIIDVSNPYSPSAVAQFNDGGLFGHYVSVAATANTLCAADGANFKVFDVSQPNGPVLRKTLDGSGGYQVLAGNGAAYLKAGDGVRIYDVTTPSSSQWKATISNNVVNSILNTANIGLVGTTLFVAGSGGAAARFVGIDVSNPSAPAVRGTKNYSFSGSWGVCVAAGGSKAVMGIESPNELSILDISNPASPTELGSAALTSYAQGIRISSDGNYAYAVLAEYPSALHVLDIRNPATPVSITNIPLDSAFGEGVEIRGNEVYAATYYGVYVFDVGNPSSPTLNRWYSSTGVYGVCAPSDSAGQSGNIYVADGDGGIVAFREQDIQSPNVYITTPWSLPVYTNATSAINVGGGSDDDVGVTAITWSNDRGGSGAVGAPFDSWYVSGIRLYPGSNLLTVTAFDAAGNAGIDTLMVIYPSTNQNQTITFPAIADRTFGSPPFTLVAAASSGLPVAFSVVSGPASLSSSNVLTLTGAGTVTVRASQAGNGMFSAAVPIDMSFSVAKADQAVTFPVLTDRSAGDPPFALGGSASSGLDVSYGVVSGPATVSSNVVTLLGGGVVTLSAWQPGNSNFNAAAAVQRSFNVSKVPQTISFGPLSQQRAGDAPFALGASASSGLPVTFALVSGPAILTGNVVTLTGWGTVTVRASQVGNGTYAAAADVVQSFLAVPAGTALAAGQRLGNGSFQMAFYGTVGSNYQLQASTTLTNWGPLFTFPCTNTPTTVLDTMATNYSRRFYRTVGQ